MPEPIEQTARLADRARGELLATVRELDRRRRLALDFRYHAKEHFSWMMVVVGASVVVLGAATAVTIARWRNRKARIRRERLQGLLRAWKHPQRIAVDSPRRHRPAASIALAVAIERLGRFALERLWHERRSRQQLRERGNGRVPSHLPAEHLQSV